MKKRQTTTFYIETLVLVAILIVVILVLTRVFGMGRARSQEARILTSAVSLAQNAAEAVSSSDSPQMLAQLLNEKDNAGYAADAGVTARYDQEMQPDPDGAFCVQISWEPEEMMAGTLVNSTITVLHGQETEPVYSIDAAVYLNEVKE